MEFKNPSKKRRERIDALEAALIKKGVITKDDVETEANKSK